MDMTSEFKIPIKDISDKKEWQTIVDREYGLYIGHPTTALLADGKTIVAVYPKSHGYGQIVEKKSYDGGITWSERLPVPESFSTSLEVPTIFRLTDKSGKARLVLFSGLYPIRMSVSEDDGDTWSELFPIGDYGGVVAMGDVIKTGDGEYMALFHDDGRFINGGMHEWTEVFATGEGTDRRTKYTHKYSEDDGKTWSTPSAHFLKAKECDGDKWEKIYEMFSGKPREDGSFMLYAVKTVDGGLTWSEPKLLAHPSSDKQICEPAIIRSPDGKKIVVLLRENTHKKNSFMMTSDDNGETWSELSELPGSLTGDRHCARYLKDGRLFISFRDTARNSPTWGDWVAWVGTFDDIINRREGQYRIRIMKNYWRSDCAYPGIEILPDGTIVTTTYGHFTDFKDEEKLNKAYVVSVRFKIDDVDKL